MAFLPASRALRYHHIGFLDSVFFDSVSISLPRLSTTVVIEENTKFRNL